MMQCIKWYSAMLRHFYVDRQSVSLMFVGQDDLLSNTDTVNLHSRYLFPQIRYVNNLKDRELEPYHFVGVNTLNECSALRTSAIL